MQEARFALNFKEAEKQSTFPEAIKESIEASSMQDPVI